MSFKRTVEDFHCEHCGITVEGDGYTNHCPECLWSKHVDIHPGDRAETCGGMMRPVALEGSSPAYDIVHECLSCGVRKRIQVHENDAMSAVLAIAKVRRA